MSTLATELRNKLERTIVQAREAAEAGAKAALEALAVHHHEPYGHMSPEERKLRYLDFAEFQIRGRKPL